MTFKKLFLEFGIWQRVQLYNLREIHINVKNGEEINLVYKNKKLNVYQKWPNFFIVCLTCSYGFEI